MEKTASSWIMPLVVLAIGCIICIHSGLVGTTLSQAFRVLFGQYYLVIVIFLMGLCLIHLWMPLKGMGSLPSMIAIGLIILTLELSFCIDMDPSLDAKAVLEIGFGSIAEVYQGTAPAYGGMIGCALYALNLTLFGREGMVIMVLLLCALSVIFLVASSYWRGVFMKIKDFLTLPSRLISVEDDDQYASYDQPEPMDNGKPAAMANVIADEPNDSDDLTNVSDDSTPTPFQKAVRYLSDTPETPKPNTSLFIDAFDQPINPCDSSLTVESDDQTIESQHESADGLTILTQRDCNESIADKTSRKSIFINADEILDHSSDSQPVRMDESQDTMDSSNDSQVTPIVPIEPVNEVAVNADSPKNDPGEGISNSLHATIARLASEKRAKATDMVKPPSDGPYKIPPMTLLTPISAARSSAVNAQAAKVKANQLIEVLQTFGIPSTLVATHIGPAVTKFEVRPQASIKVSRISNLADNIKMELQARQLRIEAPIPGHNAVGVEIPNQESTIVRMKEVINSETMRKDRSPMLFALGKNLFGEPVGVRLDKMPHLLIAGATGSGKSVCMNAIITSFMLRTHPDDVKMLLIDPKKVEFTPYHDIPHLIGPVINDPAQANVALKAIVKEMDDRYNLFSLVGVRKIDDYNTYVQTHRESNLQKLPYIVVIIDELADLMVVAGKEVESSIQRITQLARAAGIHLIVATQRPSTDVITGIIKANIPSRIAFAVSSAIDSRTILDHAGAERLLGNGDMLYMPIGEQTPLRVQGVYVSDDEVNAITDYAKKQRSPRYADTFVRLEGVEGNEETAVSTIEADPLFMECRQYVIQTQKASTSLLQRRFQIGYNRAARIIEALEENGVIGPAQGSKPREVYISNDENT